MYQIMQATYQNGHLILNQKLKDALEGQTLNIIVLTDNIIAEKKERFLDFVDRYAFSLPVNYHFDRDELHAR
jgi:hypothetical protein